VNHRQTGERVGALAESIRTQHAAIMETWLRVAGRSSSALGLDAPSLRNLMPLYLLALAEAPQGELGRLTGRRRELLEAHLSARLREGFELAEMIDEVAILDPTIVAVCEGSAAELDALFAELGAAAALAAQVFKEHLLHDEQADKRLARALERIAGDALEAGARSLSARLPDVLPLIASSLGAAIAAIELFDPLTRYRTTAVSVGRITLEVGDNATTFDDASFVGHVTGSDEVVVLSDIRTSELRLPEGLRDSGIRSCLGVRLPRRHGLLGALYVGFDDSHELTARELHRIESFADRLALHLDNARLYSTLTQHVNELVEERRLRERFIATLTHDLRSGLQSALLAADTFSEAPNAGAAAGARLTRSLTKTMRMVDDLLDANKLRAGHAIPLVVTPGDLAAVARDVIADLTPKYGDRFRLLGDATVLGRWSVDHVQRAIANLATNAAKYGAAQRPITICVVRDGSEAAVSVHNEGTPIPAEERERIFEPFVRAKSTEDSGQLGWGVGLAFVRDCVASHGGRVLLDTGTTGTTFTMVLPVETTTTRTAATTRA
jgi:signal transduction histidine kinase